MSGRPIKQIVITGATSVVSAVRIYEESWDEKVAIDHPDVDYGLVIKTLQDPCYVTESKTRVGSFVFVNQLDQNSLGDDLRVPVKGYPDGTGTFKSAYYSGASSHGNTVWRRGDA